MITNNLTNLPVAKDKLLDKRKKYRVCSMKITYDMCVHRLIEAASHQIMSKSVQGRRSKKKKVSRVLTQTADARYIASQRAVRHDQTSILLLSFA